MSGVVIQVDAISGLAVVTSFDLQMPASNPVLYNFDLLRRNASAPRVLEHVVRYQRYFVHGGTEVHRVN